MPNSKDYKLAIRIAGMIDSSFGNTCNLTKRQLREIAKEAANANTNHVSFTQAMEKAGPGIDTAWGGIKKTVAGVTKAVTMAAAAATAIGAASVNTGQEFEAAMDSWSATADATNEQFIKARQAAMEMGKTTSKTATESANALEYMALAGWTVEEQIAGLPGILRLSEATALDLATTSDLVTDSMSALGVEIEALDEYLDIAAKANNVSNQNARQLMEAYIGVGGTLKNLNVPLEESAAALGVLANRGIKGSEAGNALSAVLINMTSGTGQAGKKMKELGISAFDAQGKFIGLQDTLQLINERISDMTEEEQNAALAAIGGKNHIDALNDLISGLNTTVAEGKTEWEDLEEKLENAGGALERMAQVKLDNLQGDMAILNSALDDAGIQIYDQLQEPLREIAQLATQEVYDLAGDIAKKIEKAAPTIKRNFGEVKTAIAEFTDPMLEAGGWMLDHADDLAGGFVAIGSAITAVKLAQTITQTASALSALGTAMMSNPILAAISAAALAGGAIAGLATKVKVANAQLKKENLAAHFGALSLSLSEVNEMAAQILGEGRLEKLGSAMEELEKAFAIAGSIQEASDAIRKMTWKLGAGFTLSEAELGNLESSVDTMISESLSLIEQTRYAAHINMSVLFEDEDKTGQEILGDLEGIYNSVNRELESLGKELGEVYSNALEDGIIDIDEARAIAEVQQKIADITRELTQAQSDADLQVMTMKASGASLDSESFKNVQAEVQQKLGEMTEDYSKSASMALSGYRIGLNRGEISQEEYDSAAQKIQNQLTMDLMDVEVKGLNFTLDAVTDAYRSELDSILPELSNITSKALAESVNAGVQGEENLIDWTAEKVGSWLDIQGLEDASRQNIQDAWGKTEDEFKSLVAKREELEAAGAEIPESISEGIRKGAELGAIAGDVDAIYELIASASRGGTFQSAIEEAKQSGRSLSRAIGAGIQEGQTEINNSINWIYQKTQELVSQRFSSPISVNIKAQSQTGNTPRIQTMTKHAEGGIFDTPHYGVFAEAGEEAFIPIDRSERSASIWEQTGKKLGILDENGISNINTSESSEQKITYSPVIHVYGSNEETVRQAMSDDYDRFVRFMELYGRTKQRLAF